MSRTDAVRGNTTANAKHFTIDSGDRLHRHKESGYMNRLKSHGVQRFQLI